MSKSEVIEDGDYRVTIDYDNMTTTFELMDIFNLTPEDVRNASSTFLRRCLKEDIDVELHDTISYELFEVRGE